ncbi:MAG: flavodoxin family protein [Evtepia gabavorous]
MMKMTVLYHSVTGNTKTMAQVIAEGMMTVAGVEAKAFPIENWDAAWVKESKCVVLGTPIYLADLCSAVKVWLDGPALKAGLAGKVGGAFATADYLHGGGDLGIQTILNHMMVLGMLTYSGGGSFGKPVIHLGPVALHGHLEESKGALPSLRSAYGHQNRFSVRLSAARCSALPRPAVLFRMGKGAFLFSVQEISRSLLLDIITISC